MKVKPLGEREGNQKSDSQPPAKRAKLALEKDGRVASTSQKGDSPRKQNEKAPININAPLAKVPYASYVNRRAANLFADVNVPSPEIILM